MERKPTMITGLLVVYALISSFLIVDTNSKLNEEQTVVEETAESIVSLEDVAGNGRATGFLVTAKSGKNVIITNAHVCEINPAFPIFIVYHRKEGSLRTQLKSPAITIKKDEKHDLCMLTVPTDLKVKPLELAEKAIVDSKIYIVGYPTIELLSASDGFIRGNYVVDAPYELPLPMCVGKKHYIKTVPIKHDDGKISLEKTCFLRAIFMFTDALGDHGQSGSPGLNGDGEVVGVMSLINGSARPFAFLVPLKSLKEFLSTY